MKRIIELLVMICLGMVLTGCGEKTEQINYAELTNQGFLAKVGIWEKEGDPSIKIKFNIDETGNITTNNGKDWLDMNWFYVEDILAFRTKINSHDLITDCIIELDKENVEIQLVDLSNEMKVKYVKTGSQNIEVKEKNKDEKLFGVWYRTDFDFDRMEILTPAISLQKDNNTLSGQGNYDVSNRKVDFNTIYIDWNTDGNKLKLILNSGVIFEYTYEVSDTTLKIFKDGNLINTYSKRMD